MDWLAPLYTPSEKQAPAKKAKRSNKWDSMLMRLNTRCVLPNNCQCIIVSLDRVSNVQVLCNSERLFPTSNIAELIRLFEMANDKGLDYSIQNNAIRIELSSRKFQHLEIELASNNPVLSGESIYLKRTY